MLWIRRRNLSVLEFFTVGQTFRALFWCAVKGGGHCQKLTYLQFSRFRWSLFFRLHFFIGYFTLPIFFLYFEQFLNFRFTRRPYCLFIIVCYRSTVGASIWQFLSREAVAAGIAKVVIQVIFTPISNISSNAIMVGSSLTVLFINPV